MPRTHQVFQQTYEEQLNLFTGKYALDKNKKQERSWIFASRKKKPTCLCETVEADCVCIVPILESGSGTKIVLVSQFRPPIGRIEYDFPAGRIDQGETALQAAVRELKEETGFDLKEVICESPPLFSSAGLTDESCVIIFAKVTGNASSEYQEDSEDINITTLSYPEAVKFVLKDNHFSMKCWLIVSMLESLGSFMGHKK